MKINYFVVFLLILVSCGIDKESPPALTSVANTGELDTTFNGTGYLAVDGSAGGSGNDQIYATAIDSQNRIVAVGSSTNGSGWFCQSSPTTSRSKNRLRAVL